MSLKSQIQTEHDARISTPFDREPYCRGQRNGNTLLIVTLFAILLGSLVYYSEMIITGEGYRQQSGLTFTPAQKAVISERKVCSALNPEDARCCSKNFTEKLKGIWGCL